MRIPPAEKAERYDALGLSVTWSLGGGRATRTRMRYPARRIFFHDAPMITRRDVSLAAELASPPLPIRRLSRREALAVLEMTREATALRYREYYAFTFGDPGAVLRADAGRGLQIFLIGTERGRRLPLRSGYGGFLVKNGVPIGYFEALAFFERMEVGFNLYYAFREGESAWTFARSLKFLRQALGVTSFSLDPYQIGYENEEAIASGAFWFYRKLGFRSTDAQPARPDRPRGRETRRRPVLPVSNLRPSPPLHPQPPLRAGDLPSREEGPPSHLSWDSFHVRNLALAVTRRMARDFRDDAEKLRRASEANVARALGVNPRRWNPAERGSLRRIRPRPRPPAGLASLDEGRKAGPRRHRPRQSRSSRVSIPSANAGPRAAARRRPGPRLALIARPASRHPRFPHAR